MSRRRVVDSSRSIWTSFSLSQNAPGLGPDDRLGGEERAEEEREDAPPEKVPHRVDEQGHGHELDADVPLAVVGARGDAHGGEDEEEVEGVERADVVEDVGVALAQAEQEDEEVEPPEHLHEADEAEVLWSGFGRWVGGSHG